MTFRISSVINLTPSPVSLILITFALSGALAVNSTLQRSDSEERNLVYTDGHRVIEILFDHLDTNNQPLCIVYGQSDLPHTVTTKPLYVGQTALEKMVEECHLSTNYTIDTVLLVRRKRGIIPMYPGTKWCGSGNVSLSYDDLGKRRETDKCCRAHDHCVEYILPFTRRYGLNNWTPFSKFSCRCDNELYDCLKNSPDEAADTIGSIFFNILRRPCFKYQYPDKCVRKIPPRVYRTVFLYLEGKIYCWI